MKIKKPKNIAQEYINKNLFKPYCELDKFKHFDIDLNSCTGKCKECIHYIKENDI